MFAAPPSPTVALSVPAAPFVGSSIQISATFSNASDTGYGPYVDLILPQLGADGGIAPPNNGITFTSATFLGSPVTSSVQTIPAGGCVTEPYAYQASGAHAILCGLPVGEQFVSLQLPFGSFTSAQPQAQVLITAAVSNRARVGTPMSISAHAGFTYGADALQNPATDPTIVGPTVSGTTTPTLMTVTGGFIAPETETATGPEFPRQYQVNVSVAPGQTVTNLDVSANLPPNLQYVSFGSSAPGSSAQATPSTSTPDGTITRRFASITGTGGTDASFIFTFYVPRLDASSGAVINANTGTAATSQIDNAASANWTPIDFPRQATATPSASSTSAALTDRSIAIQSSVAVSTDTSPAGASPNDTLTWSLPFQVSDYFAFNNVIVTDVLRDGTTFSTGPAPTISLSGNGFAISNQVIEPAYYTAVIQANGTTAIQVNVSAWLVAHGFGANIVGGCILPAGSAADCVAHAGGAVTGTIKFESVIDTSFHVPQGPGHDQFVDQGDIISDAASISGTVLVNTTLVSTGNAASDGNFSVTSPGTASQVQVVVGTLAKSIYAVNGVIGSSAHIRAGDVVTYRLVHSMPISTSEIYSLTDYLPLPVFAAASVTTFDPTVSAAAPPSGTAKFGPTDTFSASTGRNPTLSSVVAANSLTFTFGDVQAATVATVTDLLFSVTVSTDPFADGLFLTNQVQSTQGSTNSTTTLTNAIVAVTLDEPQVAITKGAIASSNGSATFTPPAVLPAGVTVSAPGSACPRITGTVTSAGIATTPIVSNISNVMAANLTTFAITVENTGHAPAFDINVADVIPAGYQAPVGGIKLCVRNGAGQVINFSGSELTFVTPAGITLIDGGTGALAPGKDASDVVNTTGTNIAVITFDLEVAPGVNPQNTITNTATLSGYSSSDGAPNFIPGGLTDQATTTISAPTITKVLTSTSLSNTVDPAVNIGEVATFTAVLTVPAGVTPSSVVTDALPANFAFVGCASVTSSSGLLTSSIGAFTVACNPGTNPTVGAGGTPVAFNLGTLTNTSGAAQTITIVYSAVPTNIAANVTGQSRTSVATFGYTNAGGAQAVSSATAGVSIVEPRPAVTTTAVPIVGEAGTTVVFTTTVSKGTSTSDGFEALLTINVPAGMTYVPASVSCAGVQVTTGCSFSGNTGTVTWATFTNTANITTITYSATLDATVTPNTIYTVTTPLSWTSMPGSPAQASTFNALSFERTGVTTDPGLAANTYTATSSRAITTNSPAPSKLLVTSSEATSTGNNLLVGEVVRYRLVATIPAGSSPNVSITDFLPAGLQFIDDGTARIAFVSNGAGMTTTNAALTGCAGLNVSGTATTVVAIPAASIVCVVPAANIAGAPFSAGTDPVFTLGSITNNDRDADVESVVIDLNAVVLNVATNVAGTTINNQTRITDNAVTYNSANFAQTVIDPTVTVAKTILTAPGQAGGNIVYQIVVTNTSTFSTYETRLVDVLPATIIIDSRSAVGVAASIDASAGNTVDLTWNTLTTGQTATITINGHVDPLAASGLSISNTATMTWTSLPGTGGTTSNPTGSNTPGASGSATGERTGVGGTPNLLTTSSTIATALVAPTIAKSGGPATIAIGDTLTYNLVTTLAEGTTPGLIVNDVLPAGLTYTGSTVITDAASSGGLLAGDFAGAGTLAAPTISAPANGGPVTFTFGNTINPVDGLATNNKFLVRVTARVRNIAPTNIRGVVVANTATVTYTSPNTGLPVVSAPTTAVNSTIIEPKLNVTQTVSIAAPRNDAGGVVTYQIVIAPIAPGNATAYDAALTTTIPAGMTYVAASLSCNTGSLTPTTCTVSGQTLSASWLSMAQSGVSTTITYQASFDASVNPSQLLTNSSALTWQSLPTDATNPNIRTGANGAAGTPNNYAASSSVGVTVVAQTVAKVLTSSSEASTAGASFAIGETATYTLTVTLPEGSTPSLSVLDNLPVGMDYVAGSAVVDASAFNGTLPVPVITAPGGSGADVTLAFGAISVVADNVTTNDSFTITLSAKVLNIAGNQSLTAVPNNASATIGAVTANAAVVNASIIEPVLGSSLVASTTTPGFATPVTYTYTLTQTGASNANDVVVTVTIPATITYTPGSAIAPAGWTVDESGLPGTLRFTAAVMTAATPTAAFSWVAVTPGVGGTSIGVTSRTDVATTWTSLAGVVAGERTGAGGINDYVTAASVTVTLSGIDLHITSMSDGGITAPAGSLVPYVVSFINDGNATATGVILTATVPINSTFATVGSSAGWSCANGAVGGSVCTLTVGSLGAGVSSTRTFAVRPVNPWGVGVPKVISVTSSIADDGTHGPDPTANNTGADTTPITASPDLTTTISDGKASATAGATNTYAIRVTNVGTQDAAGVVLSTTVPAHTTFNVGASDAGWVCSGVVAGSTCTKAIGGLAGAGGTVLVAFVVVVDDPLIPNINSVVATASAVDDGTGGADPTPANNAATDTDTIATIDLSTTLSGGLAHEGTPYVITATVTNGGPATATSIVSRITLPAGLTYASDDGGGTFVGATWTVGTLANGATRTLHITVMPVAVGSDTVTTEVTHAGESDIDSTPNDGSTTDDDDDSLTITIDPAADVSTTIVASDNAPNVGDVVQLTITATNAGPQNAQTTVLTAVIPAGLSWLSDDAGGAYNPATGTWTLGTLASATTSTLHVLVTVTATGTIPVPVSVTTSTFDPNLANNADSTTLVVPAADLAIGKTVNDATPNYLDNVTFTLTVSNAGPDSAKGVVVNDLLPAGLTYVSDDASGAYAGGVWTVGTIASGGTAVLHITAQVTATGTIVNTATVSADTFDPDASNNVATRPVVVAPAADIAAQIIVSDSTPDVGQPIAYTVTIHNAGPDNATGVSATINLPGTLTYVSDDGAGAYNPLTGTLTIGNLAAGASVVLVINVSPNAPGSIDLTVSASSVTFDPNLANNSDTVTVVVPLADLVVGKSVSDATPNYLGTTTFTVTVRNTGPADAVGVVLNDALPAGLTYVSDDSGGSYDQASGNWSIGGLANGATVTLHITVRADATRTLVNTATVAAVTYDPTPGNNTDSATVTVAPAGDLSITKTVDNQTPNVGDVVTFTVTVHNAGPDTSAGVSVADVMPFGLVYVSDDGAGAYDPLTGTWTIGSLAAGADVVIHMSATVTESGAHVNTATVTATTYDQDPDNNVATTAPAAAMAADLTVTDAVSNPTPSLNDVVSYTVVVGNSGPDTGAGVAVSFPLPSGFAYVSDNAGGAYDPATGTWTIGALAKGDTVTLVVQAKVVANGTLTTTAIVSGSLYDPVPANNIDSASLTVQTADLSVVKTVDVATPNYLDTVVFTIVVGNAGPSDASGVTVNDLLPAGLAYVSDDSGAAYNSASGVWTIGALADGGTATIKITARVTATGTTANDTAIRALDQVDPNSANDSSQAIVTVADAADIEVVVAGSNANPNVGEAMTVSVTVTNHGPDAAANVTLANVFPTNLTYLSDDGGGAYVPGTGIWTIGSIPPGGSVTLTFTATAATVGSSSDSASATTSTYEADLTNNADSWPVQVHPTSDLSLIKTADEPIPHNGTNITYTITLHNAGPNAATGVVVGDLLPAGLTYVSDDALGAYNAATGAWTVGAIANGADLTIHITAAVNTTGSIINTGEVMASDNFDPDSTPNNGNPLEDDQATATVNGQDAADISVTTTVAVLTGVPAAPLVGSVNLGGTVRFTITTTNSGPDNATGVATRFLLPASLQYASDDAGGAYDPLTHTWTIGALSSGVTTTFHVTATVIATGSMTGDAELMTAFEWDPDSTPANGVPSEDDQAAASVTVPGAAALTLTKIASAAQIDRGGQVTFTIAVHNSGPDTATNVVVVDPLPAGMTFVSANGAAFDASTGTWTIPSILNGETATLLLTVRVNVIGAIVNVAQLRGGDQFDPNNGGVLATASARVMVLSSPLDNLPFTDVNPSSPLLATLIAMLIGLSFLAWGALRRRST